MSTEINLLDLYVQMIELENKFDEHIDMLREHHKYRDRYWVPADFDGGFQHFESYVREMRRIIKSRYPGCIYFVPQMLINFCRENGFEYLELNRPANMSEIHYTDKPYSRKYGFDHTIIMQGISDKRYLQGSPFEVIRTGFIAVQSYKYTETEQPYGVTHDGCGIFKGNDLLVEFQPVHYVDKVGRYNKLFEFFGVIIQ